MEELPELRRLAESTRRHAVGRADHAEQTMSFQSGVRSSSLSVIAPSPSLTRSAAQMPRETSSPLPPYVNPVRGHGRISRGYIEEGRPYGMALNRGAFASEITPSSVASTESRAGEFWGFSLNPWKKR